MNPENPWDADRELTADGAAEAISSQFPEVDTRDLQLLGAGWEFDAWATADGWVFRFPRRRELTAVFDREAALLELVRAALSKVVALPHPELRGEPCEAFPYPFAGHRRIPGLPADDPAVPDQPGAADRLARDIARVLGRLHGIGPTTARAVGVTVDRDGCDAWFRDTVAIASEIERSTDAVARALEWLTSEPEVPPDFEGPPRLLHNDLCPDHLLVDPESGRLTGLIDWTDTALGDPALDFTALVAWRGWPFVETVLATYPHPFDAAARERLRFLARVQSLHWLKDAQTQDGDVRKHIGWVTGAFAVP